MSKGKTTTTGPQVCVSQGELLSLVALLTAAAAAPQEICTQRRQFLGQLMVRRRRRRLLLITTAAGNPICHPLLFLSFSQFQTAPPSIILPKWLLPLSLDIIEPAILRPLCKMLSPAALSLSLFLLTKRCPTLKGLSLNTQRHYKQQTLTSKETSKAACLAAAKAPLPKAVNTHLNRVRANWIK